MTEERKNTLAALLIEMGSKDIFNSDWIATKDQDFETLKHNQKIKDAIHTILEELEK